MRVIHKNKVTNGENVKKLIDANELIKDLEEWAESIRNIRNNDKVFFTEENIIILINKQKEIVWQDLT